MEPAAFFSCVAEIKNAIMRGTIGCTFPSYFRKPSRKFVTYGDHFPPNFGNALDARFIFLQQNDHPVNLFQFGLQLRDFAVKATLNIRVGKTIFKFLDCGFFERIQIGKFQRHAKKLG